VLLVEGAAFLEVQERSLALLYLSAADVQVTSTAPLWLNATALSQDAEVHITTSDHSTSRMLVHADNLTAVVGVQYAAYMSSSLSLSQDELTGVETSASLVLGGVTTNELVLENILYVPDTHPRFIRLEAKQTAHSNISVVGAPIHFTSPVLMSARDLIDIASNVTVESVLTVVSDSDCSGVGLLTIEDDAYVATLLSSHDIIVRAASLDMADGYIFAGRSSAALTFTTCEGHHLDVGGDGLSPRQPAPSS
jgi:hypothetical protein